MLLWSPCNGACKSTLVARATCSHDCASVGQGYEIRWRAVRGSEEYSGTCRCGQATAGICNVTLPSTASRGVYIVHAELYDTQNKLTVERASLIAIYDPEAMDVETDAPAALHVLDPQLGAPVTVILGSGSIAVPAAVPAIANTARGGKMRILAAAGGRLIDTGYVDYAVLDFSIRFSSSDAMFSWLASLAGKPLVDALGFLAVDCASITDEDLAWSLAEAYALAELINSGLNIAGFDVDRQRNTVTIRVVSRAGSFLGLDLKRLLGYAAGGCLMGAAISLIGGPITLGVALTGCLVGGLVGAAVDAVAQGVEHMVSDVVELPSLIINGAPANIKSVIDSSVKKVDDTIAKARSDLSSACSSGRIDKETCTRLSSDLDAIEDAWKEHKKIVGQIVSLPRTVALIGLVVGGVIGIGVGHYLTGGVKR